MKYLIAILCLAFCISPTLAVGEPTLADAYAQASEYTNAVRAIETATTELQALASDPDATVNGIIRAEEKRTEAIATRNTAEITAKQRVFNAASQLVTARTTAKISTLRAQQASMQLQGAVVRNGMGTISAIELDKARETSLKADMVQQNDERTLTDAETRVKPYGVVPAEGLPLPPSLDFASYTVDNHPNIVLGIHNVNEAMRALALADGFDVTAANDRQLKVRNLLDARATLKDLLRAQRDTLSIAMTRYLAAVDELPRAAQAYQIAQEVTKAAQVRLDFGTISQVTMLDSEIAQAEAKLALDNAKMEMWAATLNLQQAAGGAL